VARQHVFPVCSPASKTFVPLNKIEGGRSGQEASNIYTETEDPNYLFGENLDGTQLTGGFLYFDDTKSEFLFDLSAPLNTDLITDGSESFSLVFPWQEQQQFNYSLLWNEINGKDHRVFTAEPGSIFCVALKGSIDEMWRDYLSLPLWTYYGYGDNRNTSPFVDSRPYPPPSDKLDFARFYGGEWVTFMFTGTRFVLLGSNNWY
jgi:hypothetical protein